MIRRLLSSLVAIVFAAGGSASVASGASAMRTEATISSNLSGFFYETAAGQ